jgi:diguanylate cyclase (GGDEF)-like protein
MWKWVRSGLGRRFVKAVVASVLLSMAVLSAAFMTFQMQEYSRLRARELHTTAVVVAYAVSDYVDNNNHRATQEALRFAGKVEGLESALVLDRDGNEVASLGYSVSTTSAQSPGSTGVLAMLRKGSLSVDADIVNAGKTVGKIVLVGNLHGLAEQFYAALLVTLISTSLAIVVGFAAAAKLFTHVGNPILRLTALMREVASRRNYAARIEVTTKDETGELASAFNQMISEIGERDTALVTMAHVDALTGLGNRRMLMVRLDDLLAGATDQSVALLLLDLDEFKSVNDLHGHGVGDKLLQEVATRLAEEFTDAFAIGRLGGDEFAILVSYTDGPRDVEQVAARVHASLYPGISLNDIELYTTTSVGVVMAARDECTASELMRRADLALYAAKNAGLGRTGFYAPSMDEEMNRKIKLVSDLRLAIERNELEAHFQPLVNIAHQKVCGFECLLRWNHPERGYVSPGVFIPLAEESDLIIELGKWVLIEACRIAANWQREHAAGWSMSVNVALVQLRQPEFVSIVKNALEATGLPSSLLTLEITESMFVGAARNSVGSRIQELKSLGVKMAIDDFGTGYSSLSYLRDMPVERIKIDRSFVNGVSSEDNKALLLDGIVKLCHSMRKTVVAEGAETHEDVEALNNMGITLVQGFVFSKPVPANMIPERVEEIESGFKARSAYRSVS